MDKKRTCVLFKKTPPGTHYPEGCYSFVNNDIAKEYIDEGFGVEYDPEKMKVAKPKREKTEE